MIAENKEDAVSFSENYASWQPQFLHILFILLAPKLKIFALYQQLIKKK